MAVHRPNPVLDYLCSEEHRNLMEKEPKAQGVAEKQMNETVIRYHPVVGEYRTFMWKHMPDRSKEIIVLPDGYPRTGGVYHAHDFYEIVYVYSGHCQTLVSDCPTSLSAGDICVYDLSAVHTVEFSNPEDKIFNILIRQDLFHWLLLNLLADSDNVSSFFLHILYDKQNSETCIYLKPDERYRSEAIIHRLIEIQKENPPHCQTIMKAQLMMLLPELARQYQDELTTKASQTPHNLHIDAVIEYISKNYKTTSLEDVAGFFGYSARSMTRFLQKHTGYSFREILQDVRFSHARSMLQSTSKPIAEIATALGYQDRSNFEIAFKKYCHITPASYRKQFSDK